MPVVGARFHRRGQPVDAAGLERIAERWFSWPNLLWFSPVPIRTFGVAALLRTSLRHERRDVLPFLCSVRAVLPRLHRLVISLWPYLIWPTITLWDAAAHPISQAFLLVGTMFLLPIILLYVIWSYCVPGQGARRARGTTEGRANHGPLLTGVPQQAAPPRNDIAFQRACRTTQRRCCCTKAAR